MINQEEYEILKDLDDRLGWLARDSDGDLVAYEKKPEKSTGFWFDNGSMVNLGVIFDVGRLFQFIQWEGEEPHNISELIEEYEKNQAYEIFNRQFESLYEKIKETEVKKDIEWLKEKIKKAQPDFVQGYEWTLKVISKDEMYDLIDQLDEPEVKQLERKIKELDSFNDELIRDNNQLRNELDNQEVLSQEWIDEYAQGDYDEWAYTEDLQNLIVPKQKEVKRAQIPEWIIEWYQGANNEFSTLEDVFDNLSHDTGYNIVDSDKFRSHIMKYGGFSKMYEALSHIYFGVYEIKEEEEQKLTAKDVIEKHIELLKKQEEAVNLKPYYDLLERVKNE